MSIKLCFILLSVPFAFCENTTPLQTIDASILQNVFGNPQAFAQAVPITDVSYIESEKPSEPLESPFYQSSQDYDIFDWRLTKHISVLSNTENFLLSPLGLKLALAVLSEAATGATKAEMASVLGNEYNVTAVRHKYDSILQSLHTHFSEYILNLGSRIYLDEGIRPGQKFAAIAQNFYHTELVNSDFNNPKQAAGEINAWVSNITAGKISALVDDEDLAGTIAMVLTTLYFKGNWTHQFALNDTKPADFFVAGVERKEVPFMNVQAKLFYTDSALYDAKIVRLPYLGNKFSMYIIVPNSLTGLARVISTITVKNILHEIGQLRQSMVDLSLPKFQFDYTSVLDHVLQDLGMRTAFQDTASFPGIARGQGLRHLIKISRVLQRSGIMVNEVGSVAYSATEISLVNKFGDGEDIHEVVKANRPFLFFIQDEETNQLLFTGRVCNPAIVDGAFKLP